MNLEDILKRGLGESSRIVSDNAGYETSGSSSKELSMNFLDKIIRDYELVSSKILRIIRGEFPNYFVCGWTYDQPEIIVLENLKLEDLEGYFSYLKTKRNLLEGVLVGKKIPIGMELQFTRRNRCTLLDYLEPLFLMLNKFIY